MYKIISLAAGLHKCILGLKFNKWPFNHSFDSSHFIISVFISTVAKKLNGFPVVERANVGVRENHPTREKATRGGQREKNACHLYSRGVIFTHARVSLALLSLRKNEGLLVV